MRSIWKGAISFGLVTIPVKLYSATEQKDVSFHQVRRSDGSRIKYKRVAAVDGEEVSYGDIAKGYELSSGETVVLTDEDFKDLPLTTNRAIDVLQFVPLEELDPIFFEKSYYLEPDKAGTKPYVLLRDALEQSGKVAVVKVALRNRESLAALRVRDGYAAFDAERIFELPGDRVPDPAACQCGEVLRGVLRPWECKVFGTACTPEHAIGTCMVSPEGACAAYYNYGRFARERVLT